MGIIKFFHDKSWTFGTMNKPKPMSTPGHSTDTTGMELLFSKGMSGDTADTQKPKSMEVPISEAAKLLGISERTVWRRVIKKELKSRTRNNKRFVIVPVVEPEVTVTQDCQTTVTAESYNAHAVLDLQVLLRELQGANYRIGYLESENNTYQKQVLMLPDLESEAKRAQDQDKELQELRAELDRLKGSWWYRFTRFLSGGR